MSRSPEEREAARRDREIKRLQRAGEPIPPELLAPVDAPSAPESPAPESPAPEPPAPALEPPAFEPPASPASFEPAPIADAHRPVRREHDPIADTHDPGTGDHPAYDQEHPSGEWHFETDEHDAVPAAAPIGPRFGGDGPAPARATPQKRRRRTLPLVLGGIGALFVIAVGWGVVSLFQPFSSSGRKICPVTIPEGASTADVADVLAANGNVSSAFLFQVRAQLDGANLRSGRYPAMRCDMTYADAIKVLSAPPKPVTQSVSVVIPEGLSRREVAPLVKQAGLTGDYVAASKRSTRLNPRRYGAPKGTGSLEGFLFPATYDLVPGSSVKKLVADQLSSFKKRIATVNLSYAKQKNLTVYDVLIIASMVERETAVAGDRPKVAAVIYNRLKAKMPLGIDATTRYQFGDWTHPITKAQLASSSPYNTRKNLGLPPTPIGSPGMAAIRAAANPSRKDYLYFVVKPCGNGASAFSTNNAQFLKDQAAYNAARAKNGGKDPSHC